MKTACFVCHKVFRDMETMERHAEKKHRDPSLCSFVSMWGSRCDRNAEGPIGPVPDRCRTHSVLK